MKTQNAVMSSHTFTISLKYTNTHFSPSRTHKKKKTFPPHASMRKKDMPSCHHVLLLLCPQTRACCVSHTHRAPGAECVKEGLLGRDVDEKWHGLMECNFKLPHLQERRNRPPNFTMMMSARLHDSVRPKCQVSFLFSPVFFLSPSFSGSFFHSLMHFLLLFLLPRFPVHFMLLSDILATLSAYRSRALRFTRDNIRPRFHMTQGK